MHVRRLLVLISALLVPSVAFAADDKVPLKLELPRPLVPRWLRFDVTERMHADGSVAVPLPLHRRVLKTRDTLDGFVRGLFRDYVDAGRELRGLVEGFGRWGQRWISSELSSQRFTGVAEGRW